MNHDDFFQRFKFIINHYFCFKVKLDYDYHGYQVKQVTKVYCIYTTMANLAQYAMTASPSRMLMLFVQLSIMDAQGRLSRMDHLEQVCRINNLKGIT